MKARITSKGQITIPQAIRERLRLEAGQELDFDEKAPYLKAVRVINEKRMRSVIGCAKGKTKKSSAELIDEMRGPVELP